MSTIQPSARSHDDNLQSRERVLAHPEAVEVSMQQGSILAATLRPIPFRFGILSTRNGVDPSDTNKYVLIEGRQHITEERYEAIEEAARTSVEIGDNSLFIDLHMSEAEESLSVALLLRWNLQVNLLQGGMISAEKIISVDSTMKLLEEKRLSIRAAEISGVQWVLKKIQELDENSLSLQDSSVQQLNLKQRAKALVEHFLAKLDGCVEEFYELPREQ
ncbi:hypothetical protein GLAREA_09036 [Glarea lozoyensis ATCC 20868]|uniref:Uncharacterized protein n=1 Tax=Glarea lozoyensis (strain ATCC 20868 / MF5171) TaxID=1116229 RepID=S3EFB6_GLAL2|nr:uncharacterized protein GLAREA_09036 [Glarea lozoyensis ATCC 20868]EPE36873.1 hypothetical protein GLAREA_09036 [Glarea lozoyensis ATCC 20868]